ncbi:hypothetical protein, partial [Streptomyces brasiliscabiei]|uniref:hypothetical protein n=1 Tax=Streptomyces brasiliscabiei TaxID=2736302 RepID=UPI0030142EF3
NVELYSETLAISMLTVFLLAVLKNVARPAWAWIAAGGLAYAAALLTKAYLYFFSPFVFAAALAFFLRRQRTAAVALAVATLAGIAAQKTWDARNR